MKYILVGVLVCVGCASSVEDPVDPTRCHTSVKTSRAGTFQEVTVCEPAKLPSEQQVFSK